MPRTPNYNFERQERDRLKAAKKAEKLAEKQAAKAAKKQAGSDGKTDANAEEADQARRD